MSSPSLTFSPLSGLRYVNAMSGNVTLEDYRAANPRLTWYFNPWTGEQRRAQDIVSDQTGVLVLPPGEPMRAAR